jgi:SAM-dependent methyltransferase
MDRIIKQHISDLNDHEFDYLYNESYRRISNIHWTPIEVVISALDWLNIKSKTKVLDIGSGVGKFCSIGGLTTNGSFTGIEKRYKLIEEAKKINKKLGVKNVKYIQSNITEIDFSKFDAFYYFNPFCEQISINGKIDNLISYSQEKFRRYEDYVIDQFAQLPINTRVVTYCSETFTFPSSYELNGLMHEGRLALWIKTQD